MSIMYSSSARGSHVFRPTVAKEPTIPGQAEGLEDEAEEDAEEDDLTLINPPTGSSFMMAQDTGSSATAGGSSATAGSSVAIPSVAASSVISGSSSQAFSTSINPSISGGKRPHSLISSKSDSTPFSLPMSTTSASEITTMTTQSSSGQPVEPAKKRSRGSAVSGHSAKDISVRTGRATPASAVIGMQGSINRLTDIFEKNMSTNVAEDPATASRNRAIGLVQELDDGLTTDQKIKLISFFMEDLVAANTYISLTDPEVRKGWVLVMLSK